MKLNRDELVSQLRAFGHHDKADQAARELIQQAERKAGRDARYASRKARKK